MGNLFIPDAPTYEHEIQVIAMSKNTKKTSEGLSSLAAKALSDQKSSGIVKKLAASLLSQSNTTKQTGSDLESLASKVLKSDKYSEDTKSFAGSVLSQSNKAR